MKGTAEFSCWDIDDEIKVSNFFTWVEIFFHPHCLIIVGVLKKSDFGVEFIGKIKNILMGFTVFLLWGDFCCR